MAGIFTGSVFEVILPLVFLARFITPAPIARNAPRYHVPDSTESRTSQSACEPFASPDSDERDRNTNEEFLLQQKLLAGFRQNDVNRYNISQGGFTSDSENVPPPCIPVQYYINECPLCQKWPMEQWTSICLYCTSSCNCQLQAYKLS